MSKVFVLTTVHGRYDVRIFLKQCQSLASQGHDVTLVVQDGRGNEAKGGVKILDLGAPPASRIARILLSPWRLYRLLGSLPADIIHFHDPEILPFGLFLKKLKGVVVIYDSHEDVPRQILAKHWVPPLLRGTVSRLFESFEDFVARRLDAVVCATPFIAGRFRKTNSQSIDINNYPLLQEFSSLSPSTTVSEGRTVSYIGVIAPERGLKELLEALVLLKDVKLLLCGPFVSTAYEEELRALPGWQFVDYRGVVGRGEVVRVLQGCSLGMVTLLPSPNQTESLPIKMFEYMAAQLPIVASDFPLWRQIVRDCNCGLCVDPESPEKIAGAIDQLLSDRESSRKMGAAGREAVMSRFNWSIESRKLLDLYQHLLA